jgi:plastocyanin
MSQVRVLAIAACAAFALTGCGESAPSGPSGSSQPTIDIVGQNGAQAFSPNPAAFGGQSVVFRNRDAVTHRVVFNDGTVDTGDIAPGATSPTVIMPTAGTNYHCTIHIAMGGAVSPSSGAPPPPCEGIYCY